MGDKYVNQGQVGAMGDGAKAVGNTFKQTVHVGDKKIKIDKSVQIGDRAGRDIVKGDKIVIKDSPGSVGKGGNVKNQSGGKSAGMAALEARLGSLMGELEDLRESAQKEAQSEEELEVIFYIGKAILAAKRGDTQAVLECIKVGQLSTVSPKLLEGKPAVREFIESAGD